jgi:hypothetical protein
MPIRTRRNSGPKCWSIEPVVPGGAAAGLHLDLERGEVELVVEHGQRIHLELVEAQRLRHSAAAFVHERRRLEQQHADAGDAAFLQPALELLLHRAERMHLRDDVERHEADIVPLHRVLRTGIAETYPKLHSARLARLRTKPKSFETLGPSTGSGPRSSGRAGVGLKTRSS